MLLLEKYFQIWFHFQHLQFPSASVVQVTSSIYISVGPGAAIYDIHKQQISSEHQTSQEVIVIHACEEFVTG